MKFLKKSMCMIFLAEICNVLQEIALGTHYIFPKNISTNVSTRKSLSMVPRMSVYPLTKFLSI